MQGGGRWFYSRLAITESKQTKGVILNTTQWCNIVGQFRCNQSYVLVKFHISVYGNSKKRSRT